MTESGGDKPGRDPSSAQLRSVPIALGARSYDVLIGPKLLATAGGLIAQRLPGARCGIVTDENVAVLHLRALNASLTKAGINADSIVLPAGEASKSFSELAPLCEKLLEMNLERGDCVVALGGGVIGDLAGFAAAILRRGVAMVQIPTSLLAQVDSSVGGKTGINTPQGKNLIGAFHQPSLVLADTDVLATLPARQLRAGYAEIAKYGLIGDYAFFEWLEKNWQSVLDLEPGAMTRAIETSCAAKAAIVARDETEAGERALLNLGHTFGHALEAYCGYTGRLLHGEAIAIGMVLAFALSQELGHCAEGTRARVAAHFAGVGLPTRIADIPGPEKPTAAQLMGLMGQDKKIRRGRLTFILARAIGDAFITSEPDTDRVRSFLERQLAAGN